MVASSNRSKSNKRRRPLALAASNIDPILEYRTELVRTLPDSRFIVFLCGPSIKNRNNPGSRIRRQIMRLLRKEKIEVFLGEDDGLEDVRMKFKLNAQDNELEFIRHSCDAVIIVAGSVGSFCELGLFSWHYSHDDGVIKKSGDKDFIVLIEKKHRNTKTRKSYLNEGPGRAVLGRGMVSYIDFNGNGIDTELESIIQRILERRTAFKLDRRGRPPKKRTRPNLI
jgi:hypothetical protein